MNKYAQIYINMMSKRATELAPATDDLMENDDILRTFAKRHGVNTPEAPKAPTPSILDRAKSFFSKGAPSGVAPVAPVAATPTMP